MSERSPETTPQPISRLVKGAFALLACAGVTFVANSHDTDPTANPQAEAFMENVESFTPVKPYNKDAPGSNVYSAFCNVIQDNDSFYSPVSAATDIPPKQFGKYYWRQYVSPDTPMGFDLAPSSKKAEIAFNSGYTNESGEFSGETLIRGNFLSIVTEGQNITFDFSANDAPDRSVTYILQENQSVSGESDMIEFGAIYRSGHFLVGLACSEAGTVDIQNARTIQAQKVDSKNMLSGFTRTSITLDRPPEMIQPRSVVLRRPSNQEIADDITYYADQMNQAYNLPPYGQNYRF